MPSRNSPTIPPLLTKDADLKRAVSSWAKSPMLAVDTEFVRERTFFPQLALVQVSDGRLTAAIDPLAINDLAPFVELLESDAITKAFHSASEDIEALYHHLGTVPRPILDTQVAAAFCGFGLGVGYQSLVEEVLGTSLHKGETRSDWLARPLSQAQLRYAAEDVEPLFHLARLLQSRLKTLHRLGWAREESEILLDVRRFDPNLDGAFQRIRGHRQLPPQKLEALRRLAAWREEEARKRDLPRNFVVRSNVLLKLARELPRSMADLGRIEGVGKRSLERYGRTWITLIEGARETPREHLPARPAPVSARRRKEIETELRQAVTLKAEELDLPAPLLASRRMIEELATVMIRDHSRLPSPFNGWRREALGEGLLNKLRAAGVRL